MRFLFVLNNGFYLRNYGTVLRALAADGHEIVVTFTLQRPGDADLFARFVADGISASLEPPPKRTGWWWAAADPIRALRDYLHYQQPAFRSAERLIERASARVPRLFRLAVGDRTREGRRRRLFDRALAACERSIPPDPGALNWLSDLRPDAVLFSPLLDLGYEQVHLLKAAGALGLPTGHLVASWDNLLTKGRIQIAADCTIVWNEFQRNEAIELHGCPSGKIVVTGAQPYDDWFKRKPRSDRAAFCERLGLDPQRPIILYACSAPFICTREGPVVTRWLSGLRDERDRSLKEAQIIIRPHPANADQWQNADLGHLGPVIVSGETATIAEDDRQLYFDTLTHAAAVVGINTSVFLEAGIVGLPCFAVRDPEIEGSQTGTLHFRYLTEGGLVEHASSAPEHFAGVRQALSERSQDRPASDFIASFLRPNGWDVPALPIAKKAVADIASLTPAPQRRPGWTWLVLAALWPIAALYLRPRYLARRASRPPPGAAVAGASLSERGGA